MILWGGLGGCGVQCAQALVVSGLALALLVIVLVLLVDYWGRR